MPKALYLHIPFCEHLCSYCDFPKVVCGVYSEGDYLRALISEIESFSIPPSAIKTIYVGGGTPSALSLPGLETLLSFLRRSFGGVEEFTFECNPESVDEKKAELFANGGVNRVSLGVQSADPHLLRRFRRHHDPQDVVRAVSCLRRSGIDNINLDFIYGMKDGLSEIDEDIDFALSLNPTHLSFYSLQVEEGTLLFRQGVEIDPDHLREEYDYLRERLSSHGFHRYEVSNFCRPGFESRHNLTYWHDEEYYGCGLGASGFLRSHRYRNTTSMPRYMRGDPSREVELVDSESRKLEYLMLHLRLSSGFSLEDYRALFHEDFLLSHRRGIQEVSSLVEVRDGRFRIKDDALYVMDQVLLALI